MAEGGYKLTGKRNQSRHQQQHKRKKTSVNRVMGVGAALLWRHTKQVPAHNEIISPSIFCGCYIEFVLFLKSIKMIYVLQKK
jgi:hypothetical protein